MIVRLVLPGPVLLNALSGARPLLFLVLILLATHRKGLCTPRQMILRQLSEFSIRIGRRTQIKKINPSKESQVPMRGLGPLVPFFFVVDRKPLFLKFSPTKGCTNQRTFFMFVRLGQFD